MKHVLTKTAVEAAARGLHRHMSLRRAATMCGVAQSQVARWRDGAALTEQSLRAVALGMVAGAEGMVGTFGRIDTRGHTLTARVLDGDVVEVTVQQSTMAGE